MLVLSRKIGEKILVGDKISVTVVRIGPGIVRIGVEAPADMAILREELVNSAGDSHVSSVSLLTAETVPALPDDCLEG